MSENIYVFKTNIEYGERINGIKEELNSNPNIERWYLDQEDIDNVLKVETKVSIDENSIISIVQNNGYVCQVLADKNDGML
jgi:hypothetical protein